MSLTESGGVNTYVEDILEVAGCTITWKNREVTIRRQGRPIGTGSNVALAIANAYADNPKDADALAFSLFMAGAYACDPDMAMEIAARFATAEEDDDVEDDGVEGDDEEEEDDDEDPEFEDE